MILSNMEPGGIIQILGKVLLHSIWILGLASIILWITLALFRNFSARLKYNLSLSILIISLTGLAYIFIHISKEGRSLKYNRSNRIFAKEVSYDISSDKNPVKLIYQTRTKVEGHFQSFFQFYEKNTNLIVLIWLTGIFLLSLRTTGGLVFISRLKSKGTAMPSKKWMNRFVDISGKIKIYRKIKILLSTKVKTPVVIGFIKPVILIPISLFTYIPPEQIDAIIAHELAHIKRNDYLINLIQTLFEILFFYHPCVWWISNVIRKERENCCDDIAVSICGGLSVYINALKNLEEMKTKKVLYAAAFTGKKFNLYKRMKRLVSHPRKSIVSGRITSVILVFAVALVLILNIRATMLDSTMIEKTIDPVISNEQYQISSYQDDTLKITKEEREAMKAELKIIVEEMKKTMQEVREIDMEQIQEKVNIVIHEMQEVDLEKIREEMKNISKEMKEVDTKKIQEEIEKSRIEIQKAMNEFNAQHKEHFKHEIANAQKELQDAMEHIKSEEFQKDIENAMQQHQQSMVYFDSIRNSDEWQEAMNEVKHAIHEFNEQRHEVFQEYFETMREVLHEHNETVFENIDEVFEDIDEEFEEIEDDLEEIQEEDEKEEKKQHELELKKEKTLMKDKVKTEKFKQNKFQEVLKSELVNDKLMDGTAFKYRLTGKKLYINGKKQSKKMFQKYSGLHKEYKIEPNKNGEYLFSGD